MRPRNSWDLRSCRQQPGESLRDYIRRFSKQRTELPNITSVGPIKDLKGVQRVMECLAALSRFISRLGERGLPLYRLLRKAECFTWTPEAEEALGNLKALLTNAPILVPPLPEKPS